MSHHQPTTQTQDTDYSSDFDSFAATFNNFKPKEFKPSIETSNLILSAARLELESMTLKQTMSETMKSFLKLPGKKLTETLSQIKQIQKDIQELKLITNKRQSCNQDIKEELLETKDLVLNKQDESFLQIEELLSNHWKIIEKGFQEQTNQFLEIIQNNQHLLEASSQQYHSNLQEKIEHQLIEYNNKLTTQLTRQDKDIQEIKQFLKLLVPRVVGIEASYRVLSTENPIMGKTKAKSKPKPIKRKKQS